MSDSTATSTGPPARSRRADRGRKWKRGSGFTVTGIMVPLETRLAGRRAGRAGRAPAAGAPTPAATGSGCWRRRPTCFRSPGSKAPVEEVARRAGVGVGTVCRNFPTKQALVEAVARRDVRVAAAPTAEAALADPDPGHAFEQFVVALLGVPGPPPRPRRADGQRDIEPPSGARRGRARSCGRAISELVARAQAAGAIRADIGPADVSMLFSGVAHATARRRRPAARAARAVRAHHPRRSAAQRRRARCRANPSTSTRCSG